VPSETRKRNGHSDKLTQMKDKLFLDTNIVVDLLGEREPFYDAIARIATLADRGSIRIVVSALTYPIVYFLLEKYEKKELVREKIRKFRVVTETSDLTDGIIDKGLASGFSDFEDALQYFCAVGAGCTVFITRNGKDFKLSELPVLTPDEYLGSLTNT
jgi:predicted nucleic acid-binding protein